MVQEKRATNSETGIVIEPGCVRRGARQMTREGMWGGRFYAAQLLNYMPCHITLPSPANIEGYLLSDTASSG